MKDQIDHKNFEHFHGFLGGYSDIFTESTSTTKYYGYHNLIGMI